MRGPSTALRVPRLSRERKGGKSYQCDLYRLLLFTFSPFLLLLFAVSLSLPSCTKRPEPYKETRFMMGTIVEMVLYDNIEKASAAAEKAYDGMSRIEEAAHPTREGSPLMGVRNGEEILIDGDLATILETAMGVSRASSGAFDPTLGAVVDLWGFGREEPGLPSGEEISEALTGSGYTRVPEGRCCPRGMSVWFDLGGVAKGYAVDEAVRLLKDSGIRAGIVNAGGDLRSFGDHPGRGHWNIGVQDPDDPGELVGVLEIRESAVATSGDYQRYFKKDGIEYHHILDPATGYPARSGLSGTTIVATDCATADALATAAFVLGPERGLALLEGWKGAEGVLITEEEKILTTSGIGEGGIRFERR